MKLKLIQELVRIRTLVREIEIEIITRKFARLRDTRMEVPTGFEPAVVKESESEKSQELCSKDREGKGGATCLPGFVLAIW